MSKCPAYCPPTCEFTINYCDYPIYCEEYDCTNPETCTTIISSDCVVYEGISLQQYGIENGATATEIIIQLANLVFPGCTTTTTLIPTTTTTLEPISTTTTICQRPQGLTTFTFFSSIEVGGIPPFINFTATLLDACQALDDNINVPNTILNGLSVEALSLTVGSTIYNAFTAPDCTVVLDGYYISFDISSTEIYHVVGGILTEILTCP